MAFHIFQYLGAGLLISLSGSLPLGNLNVCAMQVAAKDTLRNALLFAFGVTLIEVLYLRITLSIVNVLSGNQQLFYYFRGATILVLLILAVGSFRAARCTDGRHVFIDNSSSKFLLGAAMSAMNPMQIPFWMGWAVYLLSNVILVPESGAYNIFTVGAGIGTFLALLVFIFAGIKFAAFMERNRKGVNISMGCLFVIMAFFQAVHLF